MPYSFFARALSMVACACALSACGVFVEQGAGPKMAIPASFTGLWRLQAQGVEDKLINVKAAGDSMTLSWQEGTHKSTRATLHHYGDSDYVVIENSKNPPSSVAVKVAAASATEITLQVFDKDRVAVLLDKMKIQPKYKLSTWNSDIVLDVDTFKKLLDLHDDTLFFTQAEIAITLSKIK
ncbi:hypothetical protein [Janthinobacterium agaricidamnosum]|uniref:Putative lipoprotein n=1 Tax=Janthinobacterium agaricidamnosum NBRC 102515 = DSM 9628 TaxID=1349767 RepID=W0V488_9BURK|nr:hypothetical protein [Janthinobacterium agaricidamnosum]CDG82168.1 putative lipoprotein [Janthinobacterium agaricidamnosum NBRC 102515 = DSM 9628]